MTTVMDMATDSLSENPPGLIFTMGNGIRRFEVWDGGDHIRVVIQESGVPHQWFYLNRDEALQLESYLTNWTRTHG